jgi:DNA-binding beta-propeller fold protein YncE
MGKKCCKYSISRPLRTFFGYNFIFFTSLIALTVIVVFGFENKSIALSTALIEEINVQKLAHGFDLNIIKQANVVYDPNRHKVYVSGGLSGSALAVINPDTDTIESIFDLGLPGGVMALGDSGQLYVFSLTMAICSKVDPTSGTGTMLPDERECQEALDSNKYGIGRLRTWKGYSLISENSWNMEKYGGFAPSSTQEFNGEYNKIKLLANNSERGAIVHGPDALFFDIDPKNGKIYASNTGDCSISVFDLNKMENSHICEDDSCWVKDIHLGTFLDEIMLDSANNNIYIRNRLGGSIIYKYNQSTRRLSLFADNENNLSKKKAIWRTHNWHGGGISMWPTGFALSQDGKEMYVLSHFNASIDVIDTATGKFSDKIIFQVPWKPRTDSLSAMTMDYLKNRLFAVFPELGLIYVTDLNNKKVIQTINLSYLGFNRNRAMNRGPGLVKLAYNSKMNKLCVYLNDEKRLLKLDGISFQKENELLIRGLLQKDTSILLINEDKNELYLGNLIIDSNNLQEKGYLAPFSLIIVGFNNSDNSLYADQTLPDKGRYFNILYKFVNNKIIKELSMGSGSILPAKYYFDFSRSTLFAYFMGEAKIRKFDLQKMDNFSGASLDRH